MNAASLAEWLTPLSLEARARALTLLSYRLTIHGRDYGIASVEAIGESSALKKLVGINELQHKLLCQTGRYLEDQERTAYPVDVFCQILFQMANNYGIAPALDAASKSGRNGVRYLFLAINTTSAYSLGLSRCPQAMAGIVWCTITITLRTGRRPRAARPKAPRPRPGRTITATWREGKRFRVPFSFPPPFCPRKGT